MGKHGQAPSRRQYAEDAPTQVDDLVPAPPRVGPPSTSALPSAEEAADTREASQADGSSRGLTGSSALVTAHETLGLQEATRTRTFMYVALGLAVCQAGALAFVGGDPVAKGVFVFALGVVVVTAAWLLIALRGGGAAYTVPRALVVVYATIFAAFSGIYFYGVFSPGPAIVPLGVQFYCTGQSDKASVSVIATCAMAYAILAGLVMTGTIPDAGIIRATAATPADRVVMLLLVETIFAAVYLTARGTRAATIHAIEQHDVVVRSLAQRDALLREARHELVQAMRVGGIGRYSGEVVGTFRLGSLIGRGAMGEVYEGVRLDSKEEVAVKLIHPQLLVETDIVERFLREAKITSSLSVPNVVRVVDASPADAPIPYLAMERLRGQDLATFLRDNKRMAPKKVATMLREVAAGLDAAHAAGVVHRDLKPRNLFCAEARRGAETWKVLDFGVSKLDAGDGTLTHGQIIGTPGYMAPEQARGREVGPRSDVFALGVVAYRALTGSPPFSAETSIEILSKICSEQPARAGSLVRLPEDVDLVLALALAKDPRDRFASAGDLARAFDAAMRGRIDPRLAARAHSILAALPWGQPTRPERDTAAASER
ncbi:MAG: serine/threonine protein kinase [Labilithrix sp.]|nr:serine/threonine protein kinase [Labilithrix sp.]